MATIESLVHTTSRLVGATSLIRNKITNLFTVDTLNYVVQSIYYTDSLPVFTHLRLVEELSEVNIADQKIELRIGVPRSSYLSRRVEGGNTPSSTAQHRTASNPTAFKGTCPPVHSIPDHRSQGFGRDRKYADKEHLASVQTIVRVSARIAANTVHLHRQMAWPDCHDLLHSQS